MKKSPVAEYIIGKFFEHMNFLIPAERLAENEHWVAFHHPKPSYPFHALLVPKKAVASISSLQPSDSTWLVELFPMVQEIISQHHLDVRGYRLIINGGENQSIPQLHFHLISEKPVNNPQSSIYNNIPFGDHQSTI